MNTPKTLLTIIMISSFFAFPYYANAGTTSTSGTVKKLSHEAEAIECVTTKGKSNNCDVLDRPNDKSINDAINIALAQKEIKKIKQPVTRKGSGKKEDVEVSYRVIVEAIHPGSTCFTYYSLGKIKQVCLP